MAPSSNDPPPSIKELHPFDPRVLEEPGEYDRWLRENHPVYREPNTGIVLVSSYEHLLEAVRSHERFSNRFGQAMAGAGSTPSPELAGILEEGYPPVDTMLTADPPEHKRFRGLVNKAFTPRRVNGLEEGIQATADSLVDSFIDAGRFEVVSDFAVWLPLTVIADQLGVPRDDLPRFREWTDGFTTQLGGMAGESDQLEAARRVVAFQRYFAERLTEAEKEPRADIISDLVRARVEGERPLDVSESLSILQQLLVAGNETTAATIAQGLWLLVQHPAALDWVREDFERIPLMVEEILRLASPTQNMWRVAAEDSELGGVEIRKGEFMMLRFGAANRDAERFPDPDRFDPARANAEEHLAFGHGIHFCIGAMLARKELLVAFRTLLSRIENPRLAPGDPPRHKPSMLLRSLEALHIEFERR